MRNRWSDKTADEFIKKYAQKKVSHDLALRVYSSRLLGQEHDLVLHGGGNTSVKTKIEVNGVQEKVLCVKGSGWDLGQIEPEGLPAVKIGPLCDLFSLNKMSDEEMVNTQRVNLIDASSPNPSVETLLHAFLPHKYIDHTHSNAILALTNQPNGREICHKIFGNKLVYVPYIMPGFALAKKCKILFDETIQKENCEPIGMLLLNHGIVSFGNTAQKAYANMIDLVTLAEDSIEKLRVRKLTKITSNTKSASVPDIAPILRGLLTHATNNVTDQEKKIILEFRNNKKIRDYIDGTDIQTYSQKGTVTPDHVIRVKPKPLLLTTPAVNQLAAWKKESESRIAKYIKDYKIYFNKNNRHFGNQKKQLDPIPRLILIPKVGLFAVGSNSKNAKIAADLGEVNAEVIKNAEEIGSFECISEKEIFEIEHWSLEQAKLGKSVEKPLQRHVVVITGGCGSIGAATAKAFAEQGAEVVLLDIELENAERLAKEIGCAAIYCDVTDHHSVSRALATICKTFGGIDILVSNAGAAWDGEIGSVDSKILRQSFELNFWSHQTVAQETVKIMTKQKTGGCLLFNVSKQAINPGRNFGPYGLPKAATLFLMKQYALDHSKDRIRSNAVNADRIRSGLLTQEFISSRAAARGLKEDEYMSGNLLGREVKAVDVADAFVYLAKAEKTTAAVITVDGGNIEASLR